MKFADFLKSLTVPVVVWLLIFASAGTVSYWQGWLFFAVFVISCSLYTIYLIKYDPALLKRRMQAGPQAEQRPVQRAVMFATTLGFMLLIVFSGIDYRFQWSHLPSSIVVFGNILVALSLYLCGVVSKENTFAAATIRTFEGQYVISTGLYGIVRHPMYSAALLLVFGMTLALGSMWATMVAPLMVPILIARIIDEESCLRAELQGYNEYCERVRYRLIPWVY